MICINLSGLIPTIFESHRTLCIYWDYLVFAFVVNSISKAPSYLGPIHGVEPLKHFSLENILICVQFGSHIVACRCHMGSVQLDILT